MAIARRSVQPKDDRASEGVLSDQPVILYLRKSSQAEDRQAASLERQEEECRRKHRQLTDIGPIVQTFRDSKSGRTFDERPGFIEMYYWCKQHKRDRTAPGYIMMWEASRFGRALIPGTEETDFDTSNLWVSQFALLGWRLWPLDKPPIDNGLGDQVTWQVMQHAAAKEGATIARRTKSGRKKAQMDGYWSESVAPWPAARFNAKTGQLLNEKLYDAAGNLIRDSDRAPPEARVVLGERNDEAVAQWHEAAKLVLDRGFTVPQLTDWFNEKVPTARGDTRWSVSVVRRTMTNEALIGYMVRKDQNGVSTRIDARWDPIVDVDVFRAVCERLQPRKLSDEQRGTVRRVRKNGFVYLLNGLIYCATCSLRYVGSPRGVGKPAYHHAWCTNEGVSLVDRQVLRDGGCRCFTMDAGAVHGAIKDLILRERGSAGWAASVREMFVRTGEAQEYSSHQVRLAENRLRQAEKALGNKLHAQASCKDDEREFYLEEVRKYRNEMEEAKYALQDAQNRQRSVGDSWAEVAKILSETQGIVEAFAQGKWELCRTILDWWVDRIEVWIEYIEPRTERARKKGVKIPQKVLYVWLHSAPNDPRAICLPTNARNSSVAASEDSVIETDSSTRMTSRSWRGRRCWSCIRSRCISSISRFGASAVAVIGGPQLSRSPQRC